MTKAIDVELRGTVNYVGLRFQPGGFHCFFALPACELTDRIVPLEDVVGSAARPLLQCLADEQNQQARAAILKQYVRSLRPIAPDALVFEAIERIRAATGNLRIASLQNSVPVGTRQLRRRFHEWVGIGPKTFSRVIRFQSALRRLREAGRDLLGTALDSGYYDQAHFTHEFEQFFGATPSAYLRNRA